MRIKSPNMSRSPPTIGDLEDDADLGNWCEFWVIRVFLCVLYIHHVEFFSNRDSWCVLGSS